jgi:hypothetical protein
VKNLILFFLIKESIAGQFLRTTVEKKCQFYSIAAVSRVLRWKQEERL